MTWFSLNWTRTFPYTDRDLIFSWALCDALYQRERYCYVLSKKLRPETSAAFTRISQSSCSSFLFLALIQSYFRSNFDWSLILFYPGSTCLSAELAVSFDMTCFELELELGSPIFGERYKASSSFADIMIYILRLHNYFESLSLVVPLVVWLYLHNTWLDPQFNTTKHSHELDNKT